MMFLRSFSTKSLNMFITVTVCGSAIGLAVVAGAVELCLYGGDAAQRAESHLSWSVLGMFVIVGGAERDADGDDFLVVYTAQPVACGLWFLASEVLFGPQWIRSCQGNK